MTPPRLIPVLDVLHGVVVRGVGGRRHEYQPIQSRLTSATDPFQVASAMIHTFRPAEIYIADLDAIQGRPSQLGELPTGVTYWVDAGVANAMMAAMVAERGWHVVAGLETVGSVADLNNIVDCVTPERVIFSLDLKAGKPLREWHNATTPLAIATQAIEAGIRRMILLDLAQVGSGGGTGTNELCHQLATRYPHVSFITGGGLATQQDIIAQANIGAAAVLIASALHDGRLVNSAT